MSNDETEPKLEKESEAKKIKLWEGKATKTDKFLLIAPFAIAALLLGFRPFHAQLLADHPTLLALLTGSNAAVGAGGSFAKVNDTSLLIPIAAGIVGSIKFAWLFWWAGRRWGKGIIDLVSPSEKLKTKLYSVQHRPWYGRVGVVLCELPGVPGLILQLFAGWQRMRLVTFMALNAISASVWITFVACMGYALGQRGVDLVMLIDKYALWITLGLIVWLTFYSSFRAKKAEIIRAEKEKQASLPPEQP